MEKPFKRLKAPLQCDEAKPECGSCVRFDVACDFLPWPDRKAWASKAPRPDVKGPGRPRANWSCRRVSLVTAPTPEEQSSLVKLSCTAETSLPLDVESLELFHHYMATTAATLGDAGLWRDEAPKLGRQHPCIHHIILSISAHHLAKLRPVGSPRYLLLAEQHYEAAVRGATSMLPHLDIDNCQAMYIVTVLICFTAFAKGPAPGDLLLIAGRGSVPWLSLLQGVRLVLESIGSHVVFTGILTPRHHKAEPEMSSRKCKGGVAQLVPEQVRQPHYLGWDWRKSFKRVVDLASSHPDAALAAMYKAEIESLAQCFETTFGAESVPKCDTQGQVSVIMAWVYSLRPEFLEGLEQKAWLAVAMLGYFAVLLQTVERYWFIEGWSSHILREVKQILGQDFDDLFT